MSEKPHGKGRGQVTIGLVLIVVGLSLVLDHLGVIAIGSFAQWWPAVVLVLAVGKLVSPPPERDVPEGVMLLLLGAWFLCVVHDWYGLTWRNSWPLIFVALGAKTVLRALAPRTPHGSKSGATEVREDIHA